MILILAVILSLLGVAFSDPSESASIILSPDGSYSVISGIVDDAVAYATYIDTYLDVGCSTIQVHTSSSFTNEQQAYAAGYVEGYLTSDMIGPYFRNSKADMMSDFGGEWAPKFTQWNQDQWYWMESMVDTQASMSSWWHLVGLMQVQLEGLLDGYNSQVPWNNRLTLIDLINLNAAGEWDDLEAVLYPIDESLPNHHELKLEYWDVHNHCTGAIRLLPDYSDFLFAQDTWSSFAGLTRINKLYDFNFVGQVTRFVPKVVMSSYPAVLFSMDDYYTTSANLNVLETTFSIFNEQLYEACSTSTVPTWIRCMVANRMSYSGPDWVKQFTQYNSGTYNNQYMIVKNDMLAGDGTPPELGFVTVVENLPGVYRAWDATQDLIDTGYLLSINSPSDPFIYNISGNKAEGDADDYWSYDRCARYLIFERDMPSVMDYESFQSFMRYNNWMNDPLSSGDGGDSICSRYDQRSIERCGKTPSAFGGLDSKTSNQQMSLDMSFDFIAGPTTSNGNPPFSYSAWESLHGEVPHEGIPDIPEWEEWVRMDFK